MQRFLSLSVGILALAGCGPKAASHGVVSGSVTYKGQPVNGAALMLYKTSGSGDSVIVPVTQEGTYRAADLQEGEYVVVVQPSTGSSGVPSTKGMDPAKAAEMQSKIDAMKSKATIAIPAKYKERLTSDLKITATKSDQTVNLELKD